MYSAAATGIFDEAIELAQRFLADRVRHADGVDLGAQLVDLLGLIVALAKLLLDRLQLLAQEVLALVLADFRLHLRLDLRAELEDLELLDQQAVERIHPRPDVERLQDLLLHRGPERRQARGDEVGELAGIRDVAGERLQVIREQRRQGNDALEVALDVALERVDLEVVLVAQQFVRLAHGGAQVGAGLHHSLELDAAEALDDQPQAAVGQLEHLVNVRRRADRIEVVLDRFFGRRLALREDADHAAGGGRLVDEADRGFARDGQRHERVGEQNRVAQRQHGHFVGDRQPFCGGGVLDDERFVSIAHWVSDR